MCGIVGIMRTDRGEVDREEVLRMRDVIRYRGPDGSGEYYSRGVGLGHVRLSILDLSDKASQPMISHSGRYVITYNGEIYNFRSLADELKSRGVALRSTGDTEALLEYIAEFGLEKTLSRIEGMFAFGLWDEKEQSLTLARDRHGVKPLYFSVIPGKEVRFASEMKALLGPDTTVDPSSVNAAMLGLGITWGEPTLFMGIRSVPAGEVRVFRSDGGEKSWSFFNLANFADKELYEELNRLSTRQVADRVTEALDASVEMRMISDAPVACLVSGGVDSCVISAMASKRHPSLQLYHADVEGASERDAAEQLARELEVGLSAVRVSQEDILDNTPNVTYHYEMPIMYHSNAVPFYMVSKLAAKDGIKVVLTGEGSDEYFIGYPFYAIQPILQRIEKVRDKLQDIIHIVPKAGRILWPRMREAFETQIERLFFRCELEERRALGETAFSFIPKASERNWHIMSLDMALGNIGTLLHRNDRLAMAWGLESRFPFLGYNLARIALNLPGRFKVRITPRFFDWRHPFIVDKWPVRKAAERYFSKKIAHRGKFAFRGTVYNHLKIAPGFFDGGFVAGFYGLNRSAIQHVIDTATPNWLGRLLMLEVWGELFSLRMSVDGVRDRMKRHVSRID